MRFNSKLHKLKRYNKAIQHKIITQNNHITTQIGNSISIHNNKNNQDDEQIDMLEQQQQFDDFQNDQNFDMAEYLQFLSQQQRELIKQYNPDMPALYFMTKKQKKQYFDKINNKFKKSIQKTPQRKSKNKKNLKFKNQFQIKYFKQTQKVSFIKNGKQDTQAYQKQIHFS